MRSTALFAKGPEQRRLGEAQASGGNPVAASVAVRARPPEINGV